MQVFRKPSKKNSSEGEGENKKYRAFRLRALAVLLGATNEPALLGGVGFCENSQCSSR